MTKRELASALAKGKFEKVVFFRTNTRKGWDWEPTTSGSDHSHDDDYLGCIGWADCHNMSVSEVLSDINIILSQSTTAERVAELG